MKIPHKDPKGGVKSKPNKIGPAGQCLVMKKKRRNVDFAKQPKQKKSHLQPQGEYLNLPYRLIEQITLYLIDVKD